MPHAMYYDEKITIPSLHVYGEADQVIPTGEIVFNALFKEEGNRYYRYSCLQKWQKKLANCL